MTKEISAGQSEGYKQVYIQNGWYTSCHMGEDDYMQISSRWKQLKEETEKRDGYKCQQCGSGKQIVVHHKRYPDVWGMERLSDLVTLCDKCHAEVHKDDN